MGSSSEEEDYMSDAILNQCKDVRPGLLSSKVSKQTQKEQIHAKKNANNKTKPRAVLEKEKREEGLGAALGSSNKGFALLQKMGYKPGTAIGKSGQGRVEPVPVVVKTNRGGLGQEANQKRKQEMRAMMSVAMAAKRKKMEEQHKGAFMERMSQQFTEREAERDLYKSQKVCEQLDSQQSIAEPDKLFFWPAALLPSVESKEQSYEESLANQMTDNSGYTDTAYQESDNSDEDEVTTATDNDVLEDEDLTVAEKLDILTDYLRRKHRYCVWCATNFNVADYKSKFFVNSKDPTPKEYKRIYKFQCPGCYAEYVAKTDRCLCARIKEHSHGNKLRKEIYERIHINKILDLSDGFQMKRI